MSEPPQQSSIAPCWEGVDGILVVNLDHHADRWQDFLRETGCHLPVDKLHRLSGVVGVQVPGYGVAPWFTERTGERARFWGGTAGCALSHRRAIEHAQAQGWRNVLILEDDARMRPLGAADSALIARALELPGRYMLYFGFNKPRPYGRRILAEGGAELWRIEGVLATHAYLVPASLYAEMLERLPHPENVWEWLSCYRAVDVFYRDFLSATRGVATYAVMPQPFLQADMVSSISDQASGGVGYSCEGLPHRLDSAAGLCHRLASPLRRLKVRLNSLRTQLRARRGGLPGKRRRHGEQQ